jgi:hypothetical protein
MLRGQSQFIIMIRKQREEYKSTTKNKNQKKRKNLDRSKYNTRSHTRKK